MRVIVVVFTALAVLLSAFHHGDTRKRNATTALLEVIQSNVKFSSNIYKMLPHGNIIMSPLSMTTVMGLAHAGAKGHTAEQISEALNVQPRYMKPGFHKLLALLKNPSIVSLKVANGIFCQAGFSIRERYLTTARKTFMAKADIVDFSNSSTTAKNTINKWVIRKTRKKIRNIIPKGFLTAETKLVLVNAVYFKGLWKKEFSTFKTNSEKFYINSLHQIDIPMMHNTAHFGYSELDELDAKVLEMSYKGDGVSMFIFLPNTIDGIAHMEHKLSSSNLSLYLKKYPSLEVKISVPKFKLYKGIDLKRPLEKLGVTDMFDEKAADFSEITGDKSLHVKHVVQKSVIEVNEFGTEVGTATALVFEKTSLRRPLHEFVANHPFVFLIWERHHNLLLFIGRFIHP